MGPRHRAVQANLGLFWDPDLDPFWLKNGVQNGPLFDPILDPFFDPFLGLWTGPGRSGAENTQNQVIIGALWTGPGQGLSKGGPKMGHFWSKMGYFGTLPGARDPQNG